MSASSAPSSTCIISYWLFRSPFVPWTISAALNADAFIAASFSAKSGGMDASFAVDAAGVVAGLVVGADVVVADAAAAGFGLFARFAFRGRAGLAFVTGLGASS
ncbi:MAG: hypothetical protein AB7T06_09850 [Kofleriaceae bacterium]